MTPHWDRAVLPISGISEQSPSHQPRAGLPGATGPRKGGLRLLIATASRRGPSLTADEARGLENLFLLLLLAAQVGKGVNDHPKDEVQHDDDDDEEEQEVVDHSGGKERLLQEGGREAGPSSSQKGVEAPKTVERTRLTTESESPPEHVRRRGLSSWEEALEEESGMGGQASAVPTPDRWGGDEWL